MAVFHASSKPISRSGGRSATASSAYRSASEIADYRTGNNHDYTKKTGVLYSDARDAQGQPIDREKLWNSAEMAENRKDARTAREWVVAIPHELIPKDKEAQKDPTQNRGITAVNEFADKLSEKYGVAVDVAVHAPDREGDNRNYHAHIMTTTRDVKVVDGDIQLGKKTSIELSNSKLKELDLPKSQDQIKTLRKEWEVIANKELERAGVSERIHSGSFKDRGIERIPTVKVGWRATQMERRGIATDVGEKNRAIIEQNSETQKLSTLKEVSQEMGSMKEQSQLMSEIRQEVQQLKDERQQQKQQDRGIDFDR